MLYGLSSAIDVYDIMPTTISLENEIAYNFSLLTK